MGSEKTEQPTQKRLRDARRKGQVPRSKEIPSTTILIGIFVFLWVSSDWYFAQLQDLMTLGTLGYGTSFADALREVSSGVFRQVVLLSFPVLFLAALLSAASGFSQIGFLFAAESAKPDLKRFNPAAALKRVFSKKNLMELLKSLLQIAFLSYLFYYLIEKAFPSIVTIPYGGLECAGYLFSAILKRVVVYSSIAFIVIAAVDYTYQRKQFLNEMMMTKAEVKQEYKEMEGDPHIKSKRKQLHRELTTNSMLQNVRRATVIITNPTRLAVAVYYEREEGTLPHVLAKGENLLAKRIVEIAEEEGIPVFTHVPLARDLYENAEINAYIPSELIKPVAEVLKWVYQARRQKGI
jgi:type III secretion protein U